MTIHAHHTKRYLYKPDKKFKSRLRNILGFIPRNMLLYQHALLHKSASHLYSESQEYNSERLEYLGDAILDSIVAELLFQKFPGRDEGFLTQMRSKIVNRETLRKISLKLGIGEMVIAKMSNDNHKSIYGDTLEALIGALYLDKGYKKTRQIVIHQLIDNHINLNELCNIEVDFKSRVIEWGQKNKKDVNFTCYEKENDENSSPVFVSHLLIIDEIVGIGMGYSKKEAEQNAARQALQMLEN